MLIRKKQNWIVVADGVRARIFTNHGPGGTLSLRKSLAAKDGRKPTHDLGTERPGRSRASGRDPAHHALDNKADWHQEVERLFAGEVADIINKAYHAGKFEQLVLVADPRTLGLLRTELSNPVRQCINLEVNKDLTPLTDHELKKRIAGVFRL